MFQHVAADERIECLARIGKVHDLDITQMHVSEDLLGLVRRAGKLLDAHPGAAAALAERQGSGGPGPAAELEHDRSGVGRQGVEQFTPGVGEIADPLFCVERIADMLLHGRSLACAAMARSHPRECVGNEAEVRLERVLPTDTVHGRAPSTEPRHQHDARAAEQ